MCRCRKRLFAVMAIFVHALGRDSPAVMTICASACNPAGNGRRRVGLRSDKKLGWGGISRRITAFYKFRQLISLATEPHGPRCIQREKEGDISVTHCTGQHHRIVKTRDLNESESRGENCDAIDPLSILLSRRNRGCAQPQRDLRSGQSPPDGRPVLGRKRHKAQVRREPAVQTEDGCSQMCNQANTAHGAQEEPW